MDVEIEACGITREGLCIEAAARGLVEGNTGVVLGLMRGSLNEGVAEGLMGGVDIAVGPAPAVIVGTVESLSRSLFPA